MKTEFVRFLFPIAVFLVCGALEEVGPRVLSVGFPFLIVASLCLGSVRTTAEALLLAVVAGTVEDSLGALPVATTASFLILGALGARLMPQTRLMPILAYPIYQLWLVVWTNLSAGELWVRLLVSVPISVATVLIVRPFLLMCERRLVADAR